jgi:predicted Rossmann fold flavoprotein
MTVCIIGGGASGMAAAITAASNGHRVILLERQARVGRKLLATGNGRCNLSNTHADTPGHYHGADPRFSDYALGRPDLNVSATLDWFASLGLLTTAEDSGRLYPYSNMAGSVLDALRFALEGLGVDVRTGCTVTGIRVRDNALTVVAGEESIRADAVILAAGGAAGGKVGGVMDGYRLAGELGHHRTALYPAIVQIRTDPTYPRALKGVKTQATVSVCRGNNVLARQTGEVLFTEYGVSGPAVFDVSRAASVGGQGLTCVLDLLPGMYSGVDAGRWLVRQREKLDGCQASALFTGVLHPRLGQVVVKAAGFTSQPLQSLTEGDIYRIADLAHRFTLPILGVCGFDQAQVTAGGLRTDEFDPETLESRLVPGFYACGEVLDVDGDCGGYNLQWAWSSGRLAGMLG